MISLLYRILGDASPLKRTLDGTGKDAREAGSNAGKYFGTQFKNQVLRFIGIGAVVSQVSKVIGEAVRIQGEAMREGLGVEAMQELQRAAELTGMTVEELRKSAPEVAGAFTEMMQTIQKSGGILDADTVRELSNASFALKDFARDLAPLLVKPVVEGANWALTKARSGLQFMKRDWHMRNAMMGSGTDLVKAIEEDKLARKIFSSTEGVGKSESRDSAARFSAAVHEARNQRASLAGAIVAGMPSVERAVGAAGKGVPFFGPIAEDMLKEMKKSTEELTRLSSIVNQKL